MNHETEKIIGNNIRILRERAGLPQEMPQQNFRSEGAISQEVPWQRLRLHKDIFMLMGLFL